MQHLYKTLIFRRFSILWRFEHAFRTGNGAYSTFQERNCTKTRDGFSQDRKESFLVQRSYLHSSPAWMSAGAQQKPQSDVSGKQEGSKESANGSSDPIITRSEILKEVESNALQHFRLKPKDAYSAHEDPFPDPMEMVPKVAPQIGEETLPHPIWSKDELESVQIAHKRPRGTLDWMAYIAVQTMRQSFDLTSGYKFGKKTEANWLRRIIFLETVAGVPGMMGAMVRHLRSLRSMERDHGWIHTLLEEAENERMHLMVALHVKQPGKLFRFGVVATQGLFVNLFFLAYLISPRFCHRFVGYLEEEAVKTYTTLLRDIDEGRLPEWKDKPALDVAIRYWKLPEGSTFRDMFAAIRADEAHHRLVNHTLSSMRTDHHNPFKPGS